MRRYSQASTHRPASSRTDCLDRQLSQATGALVVTINTTLLAPPCSALRIRLAGGQRPYAVVVAQPDARRIANETLAPSVDTVDFVGIANLTSGHLIGACRTSEHC